MQFETSLNVPDACLPIELMAVRHTITIRASITAYSTAVGPSSETRKRCTFRASDFMSNPPFRCPLPMISQEIAGSGPTGKKRVGRVLGNTTATQKDHRGPAPYPSDTLLITTCLASKVPLLTQPFSVPCPSTGPKHWIGNTLSAARLPSDATRPALGFASRPCGRVAFIEDVRLQVKKRYACLTRFTDLNQDDTLAEKDTRS